VREPMLAAGQVDAVNGFSYLTGLNLKDRGVPADDLTVLRYADYGCEAYGFALIVNPAFAAAKPEAVKGFLRAVIAGTRLTAKDPARAVDDVLSLMEGGSRELELARLGIVLRENILTDEVRRSGIGALDPARFARSVDQLAEEAKFRAKPAPADIFDDSFLPAAGARKIH
jgi:NitT/TauT family transport system substrate-binding protein